MQNPDQDPPFQAIFTACRRRVYSTRVTFGVANGFRPPPSEILVSMGRNITKALKVSLWWIVILAVVITGAYAFHERQTIRDIFDARDFEPSERMEEVLENIRLTPTGERIFLASRPEVLDADAFNDRCGSADISEQGHLLGCFAQSQIHLFDITDSRLSDVVEVTAVHELMHAVYQRMPQRDREQLAKSLTQYFADVKDDNPALKERMEVYSHLSASRFANELHSVLATEISDLPGWLERHFATWLADRQHILSLFDNYRGVFDEVEQLARSLTSQLEDMHASIEADSNAYANEVDQFNKDWQRFVARNEAFEFSNNEAEFYALRAEFDERRSMLDSWKRRIQGNIEAYEELRGELEDLGDLSLELTNQLDSTEILPPESIGQ